MSTTNPPLAEGVVLVTEKDEKFLRGLHTTDHQLLADEPEAQGGTNQGPSPHELLLMALGACTSMTLRMYANHKGLPVKNIEVQLSHERVNAKDYPGSETQTGTLSHIHREIRYQGELTPEQQTRFLDVANRCPVHKTLSGEIKITTEAFGSE